MDKYLKQAIIKFKGKWLDGDKNSFFIESPIHSEAYVCVKKEEFEKTVKDIVNSAPERADYYLFENDDIVYFYKTFGRLYYAYGDRGWWKPYTISDCVIEDLIPLPNKLAEKLYFDAEEEMPSFDETMNQEVCEWCLEEVESGCRSKV